MPPEVARAPAPAALPGWGLPSWLTARWKGVVGFTLTEIRVQTHETLALATSMIIQTVFIVFVWLLNPALLPFALIGAVIFSVFQVGERVTNEAAYIRIDHRLTELYHASPLTPEAYFLGMANGVMVAYLPPVIFLLGLTEVVHPLNAAAAVVFGLVLLAIWLFAASLGYVFSTLFQDSRAIWPYSSLFYNAFGVLPPVFYPFATWTSIIADPNVRMLALLLPPSASAALVTWAEGLTTLSTGEVLTAAIAVTVESIALFVFAALWARRAARED